MFENIQERRHNYASHLRCADTFINTIFAYNMAIGSSSVIRMDLISIPIFEMSAVYRVVYLKTPRTIIVKKYVYEFFRFG